MVTVKSHIFTPLGIQKLHQAACTRLSGDGMSLRQTTKSRNLEEFGVLK